MTAEARKKENIAVEFTPFQKIPRISRDVVITEKIDGVNASIFISDDLQTFLVGSRSRWISSEDDNYGFAKWAIANKEELLLLGAGHHFGEWWGQGIQRNYSQVKKRFSLFNTYRWRESRPVCCDLVPVLFEGPLDECGVLIGIKAALQTLAQNGSVAAPGFMKPEGIVIYHKASGVLFKKTIEKDEKHKGEE